MTFREFLNQKDHKPHAMSMKPPSMGALQVVKAFNKDALDTCIPDPSESPETPSVSPSRPAISPLMTGGRSFLARAKTAPRKPTQFLPRKGSTGRKGF